MNGSVPSTFAQNSQLDLVFKKFVFAFHKQLFDGFQRILNENVEALFWMSVPSSGKVNVRSRNPQCLLRSNTAGYCERRSAEAQGVH